MARIRVGISGWVYPGWRGDFYPSGLPHRRELAYAAARVSSIEVNASFYALGRPQTYARWRAETPDDFVFAVKGSRYVTHVRRLADTRAALANFFASGLLALGSKLGPVLWQLPPTLPLDPDAFDAFLRALPRTTTALAALAAHHDTKLPAERALTVAAAVLPVRHAVEVRHPTFTAPEAAALAERHGVALVVADTAGRYPRIDGCTGDFGYVRLHGDTVLYGGGYDDRALDAWAERISGWAAQGRDVYAYFDNDAAGRAPFDAMALQRRLGCGPAAPDTG
ncbi:DUF72 domain-containing protein [Rhodococcus olei]|uniref:DUF72 domain-containing protein n=1 Tax=Rhodococcus olei TaxID=2161675 RepID=A0ABP8P6X9_9NOCA